MPLTQTQLLRRLHLELREARSVCLLGVDQRELEHALGAAPTWRPWPGDDTEAPEAVVVASRQVSEAGDIVPTPTAIEAASAAGTSVAALLARADHVVALLPVDNGSSAEDGELPVPGLVTRCADPSVVEQSAQRVLCAWAVLDVTPAGLVIRELAPPLCARRLQGMVTASLKIASDVAEMDLTAFHREGQRKPAGG